MSDDRHDEVTFHAIRQFVIAPDRRYDVECHEGTLRFRTTGSQFDTQWLARGARAQLGDRVAGIFQRLSPRTLILGGIAVAAIAAVLLVLAGTWAMNTTVPLRRSHFTGFAALGFMLLLGLVMIIAGVATARDKATASRKDFCLPLEEIAGATLLPAQSELARRGEPQVARVKLQPRSGKMICLGIPTDDDLDSVKRVIPSLAA